MKSTLRLGIVAGALLASPAAWAQCVTASSSTLILAPYDVVFDTIADTSEYPDWNPYIISTNPTDVDLLTVGTEFELTVLQPILGIETSAEEIVTDVVLPSGGYGKIQYDFNGEGKELLGFPSRPQEVTSITSFLTYYETEETFCGPLVPFIPIDDVQAGFDLQTDALAVQSFFNWLDSLFSW